MVLLPTRPRLTDIDRLPGMTVSTVSPEGRLEASHSCDKAISFSHQEVRQHRDQEAYISGSGRSCLRLESGGLDNDGSHFTDCASRS